MYCNLSNTNCKHLKNKCNRNEPQNQPNDREKTGNKKEEADKSKQSLQFD